MIPKVPLTLDERTIEHFAERDRRTGQPVPDAELTDLSNAVKHAREEAERLVTLAGAVSADKSQTPEAGLIRTSTAAVKAAERIAPRLDAARAKVTAALAQIDRRTTCPPPPTDHLAASLESEIRKRLADMPPQERDDAISSAFAAKTLPVIGAVLRGPAFLAGLGDAKQALLRARYQKEHHPGEMARRERLSRALEATERAGDGFVSLIKAMTDTEASRIAAANAKRAQDALDAQQRGAA